MEVSLTSSKIKLKSPSKLILTPPVESNPKLLTEINLQLLKTVRILSRQKNTMKRSPLKMLSNSQSLLISSSLATVVVVVTSITLKTMERRKRTLRSATSVGPSMRTLPLIHLTFTTGRTAPFWLPVGSASRLLRSHLWLSIWLTNARIKKSTLTVITVRVSSSKKITMATSASGPSQQELWNAPCARPQYFLTPKLVGRSTFCRTSAPLTKDSLPDYSLFL